VEYAYWPARARVKAGTSATFINVGDIPLTTSATKTAERNTGALAKDESKAVTFAEPGAYFYICTPHPRMYGQVIVD
jgi:quinohemoprotein ethanol dehydrogenase